MGGMSGHRKIVIIAGSNGAAKTTFAREFLPFEADCPTFVNAGGRRFAVETTLSAYSRE